MDQLERARARLDRALTRLEAAQQAFEDRVRVLQAAVTPGSDWQELVRVVEDVQRENQILTERDERLRNRLDSVIARLSSLLDGDAVPALRGRDRA
jgi:cobalamin biosynthesis Mg chelatase CobN